MKKRNNREEDENQIMNKQENHGGNQISTPAASDLKAFTPLTTLFTLDPNDVTPPPAPIFGDAATTMPSEFNPYLSPSPVPKNELFVILITLI